MLNDSPAFSGFSVNSIVEAKEFYAVTLGLKVLNEDMGLELQLGSGNRLFLYEKEDHKPATFTVLNFVVKDINTVIDGLVEKGIVFERYDSLPVNQDERGILRGKAANEGPDIAWFRDPAGNILSVLSN